jgi:excisionase family DNA binding protein
VRVADAAREVGISADLIRKLERRGVIAFTRDLNGHRRLTATDLDALRRVIFPSRAQAAPEGGA